MNTTLSQQIKAIQEARKICEMHAPVFHSSDLDSALNDAGSSLAALHLSDPYKEIERLQAELKKSNEALSHYADVNQNQ